MQVVPHTFQLKIINTETKDKVIYYTIQVVDTNSKLSWQFVERYRNMLVLNSEIAKYTDSMPQFPPKKLFGNTDADFVSQRKAGLQNYFKTLLTCVDVEKVPPLKDFLTKGESKLIRDHKQESLGPQQVPQINNQQQSQQQLNKAKIIRSKYESITNETNAKFIDLGFMANTPEENDILKKRQLYDQVKVDPKHAESLRISIIKNQDSTALMTYPTLEQSQPQFFQLLKQVQNEIDKVIQGI